MLAKESSFSLSLGLGVGGPRRDPESEGPASTATCATKYIKCTLQNTSEEWVLPACLYEVPLFHPKQLVSLGQAYLPNASRSHLVILHHIFL